MLLPRITAVLIASFLISCSPNSTNYKGGSIGNGIAIEEFNKISPHMPIKQIEGIDKM